MKRIRFFLLALAIAVGGGISPVTVAAHAFQPPPGVTTDMYYYSDQSYQTLIGHYRDYCDGSSNGWGGISEYSIWYYYDC